MINTYDFITDEDLAVPELRDKIKIGMWATLCCRREMFEIKNQEDIEDIIESADCGYNIGTFEEIDSLNFDD